MITNLKSVSETSIGATESKSMSTEGKSLSAGETKELGGKSSPDTTKSVDWSENEHVSAQVQLEAGKFIEMVGNPELAKQAINAVEQSHKLSSGKEADADSELAASLAKSRKASAEIAATFLKALTDLETSLSTPVFSGELTEWTNNALRDCERVRVILLGDVQKIHAALYSSILREHVELSSQVEKLRAADARISHADCDEIISNLTQLQSQARSVKQDEAKLSGAKEFVTKQAMEFVVAARGQETAISAWLNEAFNRDLGSGD